MFNSPRKQLFRWCLGGRLELQRCAAAAGLFVLLTHAAARQQDSAATNQLAAGLQTNQPAQPSETTSSYLAPPELTNQFGAENGATNQLESTGNPPPLLGPRDAGANQLASPLMGTSVFGAPPGGGPPLGRPLLQYGPVDVHAQLNTSMVYGNGIESQPGQEEKTMVYTISPGVFFDLGSRWKLDYTPSYAIYSDAAFHNTFSQAVFLGGATSYEDWAFHLSQSYASSSAPLVETGMQTSQEAYATTLGASYQMSSTLSLQLGAIQDFRFASQFDDVEEWTGSIWLNDQIARQFGLGLGFTGGYDDVNIGSSMPFESLQGRMNFNPGKKLSLSLSGGVQDRQFVNPGAPSYVSPVFSASLLYQLLRNTTLSLTAGRSVNPSFFANQIIVTTGVSASLRQKLSNKLSLGLNAGYMTEPLTSIVPEPAPPSLGIAPPTTYLTEDANDTITTFSANLSYAVWTHGSISLYYSASQNASGLSNYKYSSSQLGLAVSYTY